MDRNWASVILSGGRGRRMGGRDKGRLTCGGKTFLELIGGELQSLEAPCYLSGAAQTGAGREGGQGSGREGGQGSSWEPGQGSGWEKCQASGLTVIRDRVQGTDGEGIGPMGGIWSCFMNTVEQCLFFVSCDMPLFRAGMAEGLLEYWRPGTDAVLWQTRDGRLQPMCGLYSRSCLKELEKHIEKGNYRMMDFLGALDCVVVETSMAHIPDKWFLNVNTPEIHEGLKVMHPPVLAVSGRKDTGKTWLLEKLVEVCKKTGIRAAVIKHDGHEFEADVPGTDSYRLKKAGAYGTVVYSGSQFSLVKEGTGLEAGDFIDCFPEADIILLEGQKHSSYPKIEVLRKAVSTEPVCSPETVLAYVSDGNPGQSLNHKQVLPFHAVDAIAEVLIRFMDGAC